MLRVFIYPIPCIPFPFKGKGEDRERGAIAPLEHPDRGLGREDSNEKRGNEEED